MALHLLSLPGSGDVQGVAEKFVGSQNSRVKRGVRWQVIASLVCDSLYPQL